MNLDGVYVFINLANSFEHQRQKKKITKDVPKSSQGSSGKLTVEAYAFRGSQWNQKDQVPRED